MTDDNQIVDVEAEVDAWLAEWGVSPSSEDAESARADAREMICWLRDNPPPEIDGGYDATPFIAWAAARWGLTFEQALEAARPFVEIIEVPE